MSLQTLIVTFLLCLIGGLGGALAALLHLPLPYMIGSLLTSGLIAMAGFHHLPADYKFPMRFRMVFMALIGVMIGSRVTAQIFSALPDLALSCAALTFFVLTAHGFNYLLFRQVGGYDRPTAFFSGSPGGLLESLALGEEAGANLPILTMQQFLRIIMVIALVPAGLSLWYGAPLGSAGGQSLTRADVDASAIPLALAVGLAGLFAGQKAHLPAAHLTGPMLAAAILTIGGWADLALPQWLVNLAQLVIGTSLGMRFAGLNAAVMLRSAGLSLLSVGGMLLLGAGCAWGLHLANGAAFDTMLISFAPGGVTEMALIALSLHANPALVTIHHIFRILLTVLEMTFLMRLFRREVHPVSNEPQQ